MKKEGDVMDKLGNINFNKQTLSIKSDSNPFSESFYFNKFYEPRVYSKFIKNVERLIRSSKEYKKYIELLRSNHSALNLDNVLTNISAADADMEFHHYPLTLYDVVDVVCTDKFLKKENFTSFSIGKEIMDIHYKNIIGLVPLTETNHELAHKGALFFSTKQIFGDWEEFVKKYEKGISAEMQEKIDNMKKLSEKNTPTDGGGLF
jgi:hypothetical protein